MRQYFAMLVACVLMLAVTGGCSAAKPLTIVKDGVPNAYILVQADAAKPKRAAEELQAYIKKMSGAELPIVIEGQPGEAAGEVTIHVGATEGAKKLGAKIPAGFDSRVFDDAFEEEGYIVKSYDNAIVVAGNNDGPYRGTIFAAYDLLEQLGCRFYFPGEWGEVIPQQTTITVPALNKSEKPDFAERNIWVSGWVPMSAEERAEYAVWGDKVRYSGRGLYPVAGDGFLAYLLPPKEYWESNPEYYAMGQDGKRHMDERLYENHVMLCLSNPDVLKESVKNLKEVFAGTRKTSIATESGFGISPPDGTPYCYCEDCKAQSAGFEYPRYVHRTMQSEEFFGFAAKLAREFPDKWTATMAYSLREMVPQGVDIPRNMSVTIAPISSDVLHPGDTELWRRRDFMRNMQQWRDMTPHVLIYDYNPGMLTGFWVPERDVANMAINAKLYRDMDIKGMNREGRKAFMQTWISYYATGKLLWDADTDVEAMKKDFYNTFFGPSAGPHVQAWWDACEQELVDSPMQAHEDFLINHIYTVDFVKRIQKHVEAARKAKMTDTQRDKFHAFDLIAQHLMAVAQMHDAEMKMEYARASAAAQKQTDLKNALNAIYSQFMTVQDGERPYFAEGRKVEFDRLAAKTDGTKGTLIAPLPLEMKFARDPFNEGIIDSWHKPKFDDSDWDVKNTYYTWDQQDEPEDDAGHDYDGIGWYRAEFNVKKNVAGKPIKLYVGGAINESWVWVNGEYVGRSQHLLWWGHPHQFELDVTKFIKPGQKNTVAIRVMNEAEIGGIFRRGFFYAENEAAK